MRPRPADRPTDGPPGVTPTDDRTDASTPCGHRRARAPGRGGLFQPDGDIDLVVRPHPRARRQRLGRASVGRPAGLGRAIGRPPRPRRRLASASAARPGGATTTLTIGTKTGDELEFDPDELSVPAGAQVSVTFENRSALPHNLTFGEPINVATDPVVAAGRVRGDRVRRPGPGDYTFACTIHPGMQGTLTVEAGG